MKPNGDQPQEITEEDRAKLIMLGDYLVDTSKPLKARFRALLALRNSNSTLAVSQIARAFSDTSALLKHELAYCLGQMGNPAAIELLKNLIGTTQEHPMVRHEAAEALALLSTSGETRDFLQSYFTDDNPDVAETCEIAYHRALHAEEEGDAVASKIESTSPYDSRDPALAYPQAEGKTLREFEDMLKADSKKVLPYNRYRALFTLRNMRTDPAILAISKALNEGESALLRHEIAYVLGQLQSPLSIPYLKQNLENLEENEMVRHEAAEALGAIGSPECLELLKKFRVDEKRVVAESCEVALDICEYELKNEAYVDLSDIILPQKNNNSNEETLQS